ncbi:protein translocase SEC61 complex subunit gamma [Candidatus Pacearchaeota archaeon]|jgi:protein transport protein SEC61 subunit gamma-like protein|nr:protein translocase SEC61 complex subunit gamma [Candidatus Pacearchaeota archaeon]|tara:strand:+ start:5819 stop:5995 length:177 start_codon:yes stop_codon:yes gene_type:complete
MELWNKTKSFFIKSRRVWLTLKKPTRKEFETITKVSAMGIIILGLLGFLISTLMKSFI